MTARVIVYPAASPTPTLHHLDPALYDRLVETRLLAGEPVELDEERQLARWQRVLAPRGALA